MLTRLVAIFVISLQVISYHRVFAAAEAKIHSVQEENALLDKWKSPKEILVKCPYFVSGFDIEKRPVFVLEFLHAPTVQYILHHFAAFQQIQDSFAYGYYVNVNAVASQFISMVKPILGSALERVEILGTQKSSWIPKLL
ncbi:unnamed protein product, partial [Allacma fusca]